MCGIAGFFNTQKKELADRRIVEAMCQTLVHRGPNDLGTFVDGSLGIGMRRLSVIDLTAGRQPMSNEDESVWVVFNGEIYNYRELAAGLVSRGHHVKTLSDTEVIVHLYEDRGDDCVQDLRGMFAFALWDRARSRLLLARDRLGVKPLYYFWDGHRIVFGSELKALLVHPAVRPTIDPEAVLYYLRYSYIPDPLSIFSQIRKLPPAHILVVSGETLTIQSYWDGVKPSGATPLPLSDEEAGCGLEKLLQEAVRLRLVSDVPIGTFLSGGIDSSIVTACMAREMSQPVKTFSIGFEESAYNELPYARQVAHYVGADHHEMIVGPGSCNLIERLVTHFDEPFGDASAIPTYYLSELASKHVTVALSGDGGDELFAGYDRYRVDLQRSRFERFPLRARRFASVLSDLLPAGFYGKRLVRNLSLPSRARYLENISYIPLPELDSLLSPYFQEQLLRMHHAEPIMEQYFQRVGNRPWLTQLQYLDSKTYLPADVLTKVDRMSMAHSLEVRSPFLDHVLVEYVTGLPVDLKLRNGVAKYLLKRIAHRFLPGEIIQRKKQGFGVPLEYWFKNGLREYIHDVLFDSRTVARGMFQQGEMRRLIRQYEKGNAELAAKIWLLLVMETWCRTYVDRIPSMSTPSYSAELSSNGSV